MEIEEVGLIKPADGEVVVIRVGRLNADNQRRLRDSLKGMFPNNQVIVIDKDTDIEITTELICNH